MSKAMDDLDDIIDVEEVTEDLLRAIADRIRHSQGWEQMVYRESEIDQLWRLIDRHEARTCLPPAMLQRLRTEIMAIHDLIGVDHRPADAARKLDTVLAG